MNIILTFNYFYIDDNYFQQTRGTAMRTICAIFYVKFHVADQEVKLFEKLQDIYSFVIAEFFIRTCSRFLDDVNYKWKQELDTKALWNLLNIFHPNIIFILKIFLKIYAVVTLNTQKKI